MTVDASVRRMIGNVVQDFINEGKMFTAFEVSLGVKERGVQERHRNMRDTVHEIIFEYGDPAGYTRTLRDVGAPESAWVYHLPSDNPYRYVPLPRNDGPQPSTVSSAPTEDFDDSDEPFVIPVGIRNPIKLQTRNIAASMVPDGAYGTDQRGRLCIPVNLLVRLGVTAGQSVDVTCDPENGKVLLRRSSGQSTQDPDASYTAEPDGNVRITQGTLEKADIEQMPCYRIEGTSSEIEVSVYDWD